MRMLLVVFSLLLATRVIAPAMDEAERIVFADGLYARGLYDLALKEYQTFLKDYPATKRLDAVHFRMGESHRQLGRRDAALKEFKFVFDNCPGSEFRLKAGFKNAEMFTDAGKNEEAAELLRAVLRDNPPEDIASATLYSLGEVYQKMDRKNDAIQVYEQIRTKYPASGFFSLALLKLGQLYGDDKTKTDEILQIYKAAAAKPSSPRVGAEALFQIAELYFNRKEFGKSAEAYRKLLADYPDDQRSSEAKLQAAWASHNAGLYAEALERAVEALKGDAKDKKAEWMYLQANCERQLSKNEAAVQTYARLIEQFPDSPFLSGARYERALTFYKMGKHKEAMAEAEKIAKAPDIMKDVYWLMGESYAALGDQDRAIQYYRLLAKEYPKSDVSCDATFRVAHNLQTKGEYKEASRNYLNVAQNFPDTKLAPRALFASAFCQMKEKMYAEAARDWSLVIQKYPSDQLAEESYYQKGLCETRLKRYGDALTTFRELMKKYPDTKFAADAHYWQGMFLKEDNKAQDAEDEFRLALKAGPAKELQRDVAFNLAVILQKTGKFDEAATLLQGLLDSPMKDKFTSPLLSWLVEYRFDRKQYAESVAAAKLILEQSKEPAWQQTGWGLVGRGYLAQGDKAKAADAFRCSLAVKAATRFGAESALALGEITLGGTNYAESAKYFERAAALASNESLLGVRAKAYAGLGKAAKATSDFENASRYFMSVAVLYDDPELIPECLYEAADAYRKAGKTEPADKAIQELKERYPNSDWAKKAPPSPAPAPVVTPAPSTSPVRK